MIDRCYIEITNICNLNCDFCPKHTRQNRHLTLEEFDLLTDKIRGRVVFLYFHLMGEPMLHPLLPQFVTMAREKGFKTVLTSNGTLLDKAMTLLDALPHKVQLSLHSHESNGHGVLSDYLNKVMAFALPAADKGTCIVLRLWNQGGRDTENEEVIRLLQDYVPMPWKERPDGFRMKDNLYLEFDRKFEWPDLPLPLPRRGEQQNTKNIPERGSLTIGGVLPHETGEKRSEGAAKTIDGEGRGYFCKAILKQIGVLSDGTVVPCCLDHDGDVPLGNLLTQSLDDILSSTRAKKLVEGFAHHTATESLCQNCESALITNSFRGKAKNYK